MIHRDQRAVAAVADILDSHFLAGIRDHREVIYREDEIISFTCKLAFYFFSKLAIYIIAHQLLVDALDLVAGPLKRRNHVLVIVGLPAVYQNFFPTFYFHPQFLSSYYAFPCNFLRTQSP